MALGFAWKPDGLRGDSYVDGVANAHHHDAIGRVWASAHDFAETANDVTAEFAYNPAGQIVSRTLHTPAYAFDAHANVNRNYTTNRLNQYVSAGPVSFGYDARGNLASDRQQQLCP